MNWSVMNRRVRPLLLAAGVALLGGCGDDASRPPDGTPGASLYVLNTLGETIDRISLSTGLVSYNVMATGASPNDLVVNDDATLWLANSGSNDVWKVDLTSLSTEKTVDLGVGRNPYNLTRRAAGGVAVTNWLANEVVLIATDGAIVRRVPVGRNPEAVIELGGRLIVTAVAYDFPSNTYGPGKVYALNAAGTALADSATVPLNPQALISGPGGRLHVICTGNYGFYEPAVPGGSAGPRRRHARPGGRRADRPHARPRRAGRRQDLRHHQRRPADEVRRRQPRGGAGRRSLDSDRRAGPGRAGLRRHDEAALRDRIGLQRHQPGLRRRHRRPTRSSRPGTSASAR